MPYIVVRKNDESVLSRTSPDALLTWERGTRDAITFETYSGASKCAQMQGGSVLRREADRPVCGDPARSRIGLGPWVDSGGYFSLAG